MISREEVAEKLRQAGERLRGSCCSGAAVFVTVKDIIGISKVINRKAFFDRLANLIDPTCKPVEADNNIVCSECGADLYDDDLYCPHCGARVVRGLETLEQVALPAGDYIDNQTLALAT